LQLHSRVEGRGQRGPAAEAASGAEKVDWKGKLQQLYAKRMGVPVEKGTFVYSVEEIPGQGFMASVAAAYFREGAYHGEQQNSKKLAEQAAARVAVEAEFGEVSESQVAKPGPAAGQKRSRDAAADADNPKGRLHNALHLILGRNATKEDLVYETSQLEDGTHVSTCSLPTYDAACIYQGEPAISKKEAEKNAAEVTLLELQDIVAPLEEEHKAKKQRLNRERLDALKQKTRAKEGAEVKPEE